MEGDSQIEEYRANYYKFLDENIHVTPLYRLMTNPKEGLIAQEEATRKQIIYSSEKFLMQNRKENSDLIPGQEFYLGGLFADITLLISQLDHKIEDTRRVGNIFMHSHQLHNLIGAFTSARDFAAYTKRLENTDARDPLKKSGMAQLILALTMEELAIPGFIERVNIVELNPMRRIYPGEEQFINNAFRQEIDERRKRDILRIHLGPRFPIEMIVYISQRFEDTPIGVRAAGMYARYLIEKYGYDMDPQFAQAELDHDKRIALFTQNRQPLDATATVDVKEFMINFAPSNDLGISYLAEQFALYWRFQQEALKSIQEILQPIEETYPDFKDIIQEYRHILLPQILQKIYRQYGNTNEFIASIFDPIISNTLPSTLNYFQFNQPLKDKSEIFIPQNMIERILVSETLLSTEQQIAFRELIRHLGNGRMLTDDNIKEDVIFSLFNASLIRYSNQDEIIKKFSLEKGRLKTNKVTRQLQ